MSLNTSAVLVPVDFSDESLNALDEAIALSPAALHVIHVQPVLPSGWESLVFLADLEHKEQAAARGRLRELIDQRGRADGEIHVPIAAGNPANVITETASTVGATLIIMPSHGRTGLTRLALGSVAESVVRLAHCPVLVLRRP